jgi:release factor glutamine methyltransferase
MTIAEALQFGTTTLRTAAIDTRRLDAEVLLMHTLKKPREFLFMYPEKRLSTKQVAAYRALIRRRTKHEPIAYLVGKKEFYGLEFLVDKRVLIPRPETELIIETVLELIKDQSTNITIADIGTGSGCIAITLKKILPKTTVIATDMSAAALTAAKTNARRHHAAVKFLRGDLLTPLKKIPIDILVSNLPYLPTTPRTRRPTADVWHEPSSALFAGRDGLDCFKKLFTQLTQRTTLPKYVVLEIGHDQGKSLPRLIKRLLTIYSVEIKKDLAKKNRLAVLSLSA